MMAIDILVMHLALAVVLFFLMNWIGGHSVASASYYQITYFSRSEEALAFNSLYRILTPTVYVVLAAAAFYAVGLDRYVTHIYLIVVYHAFGRWAYNLLFGRRLLLNWGMQFFIAATSVLLSYWAYIQILTDRRRLLPDITNISNELWIAILLFLYKLADQAAAPRHDNYARKVGYLRRRFEELELRYGHIIREEAREQLLIPLAYAILIYETFNRPTFVRLLERHVLFPLGLARSLGPMQVQVSGSMSDDETIRLGVRSLSASYSHCLAQQVASYESARSYLSSLGGTSVPHHVYQSAMACAASQFNVRSDYAAEVMSIQEILVERYFPEHVETLLGLG
jgi:hypothetical protein